jgi:hypothetical protein
MVQVISDFDTKKQFCRQGSQNGPSKIALAAQRAILFSNSFEF